MTRRSPNHAPTRDALDAYLQKIDGIVACDGWAMQTVLGRCPVSYTGGLFPALNLPEIVMRGIDPQMATEILNLAASRLVQNRLELREGVDYPEVLESHPVRYRRLDPSLVRETVRAAVAISGSTPDAWQLIWHDPTGRFEGDEGFESQHRGHAKSIYGFRPANTLTR